MVQHRGQPAACGCCNDACTIATDDFNRADAETPGANWTGHPVAGEIAGNALLMDTARTFATHNDAHPDGATGKSRASVLVIPDVTSGDVQGRLCLAVLDDDNYAFVAIFEGDTECPWFRLGVRIDGAETWLTEARPLPPRSEWPAGWPLYGCWRPGTAGEPGETVQVGGYAGAFTDNEGWTGASETLGAPDMTEGTIGGVTTFTEGWSDFGLDIPEDNEILGIVVTLWGYGDQNSGSFSPKINSVTLFKPGVGQVGDDKGTGAQMSTLYGSEDYGGTTDDWNAGLTGADLSHVDFEVGVEFECDSNSPFIDSVQVTVYHRSPPASTPGILSAHVGTGTAWPRKVYLEAEVDPSVAGASAGLEFAAGAGTVKFDNFVFKRHRDAEHPNCPECRGPCVFFTDESPEVGCHWESVAAGLLAHARNPAHADGTRIRATLEPGTLDIFLFDYLDGSNYSYVLIEPDGVGAATMTLWQVTAGTPEELDEVAIAAIAASGEFELCWFGSTVQYRFDDVAGMVSVYEPHGGERFGFDGDGTFTNFQAATLRDGCPGCQAGTVTCDTYCISGEAPSFLLATVSGEIGFNPSEGTTSTLENILGTTVLESSVSSSFGCCLWENDAPYFEKDETDAVICPVPWPSVAVLDYELLTGQMVCPPGVTVFYFRVTQAWIDGTNVYAYARIWFINSSLFGQPAAVTWQSCLFTASASASVPWDCESLDLELVPTDASPPLCFFADEAVTGVNPFPGQDDAFDWTNVRIRIRAGGVF